MHTITYENVSLEDVDLLVDVLRSWGGDTSDPERIYARFWWWDGVLDEGIDDDLDAWELDDVFSNAKDPEVTTAYLTKVVALELEWLTSMTVDQRVELDRRNREIQNASHCFFLDDEPDLNAALLDGWSREQLAAGAWTED